jgi:hypothetical protein
MTNTIQLRKELQDNEIVLQVLPVAELFAEWNLSKGINPSSAYKNLKTGAGLVAPLIDSATAFRICKDLGLTGSYVLKTVGDKQYIIFKGYAGTRSIFTAPRYLATNKKVIKMAIGTAGIKNAVRGGGILTIVLFTGINIVECILNDKATLSYFVGTMATDLIKVGTSAIVAATIGIAVGGTTALVAGPLVIAIGVGVMTGWLLDTIDIEYGLTDKLVAVIEQFGQQFSKEKNRLEGSLVNMLIEVQRELVHSASRFNISR